MQAQQAATKPELVRAMSRFDLTALALNGIIGAGIFGLPSTAARLLGVSSLLAFLACAFIVYVFVLCFAEVASRFSDSGGPYLYARTVFGPLVGFEVGWSVWLARVSSFAANANVMVSYLGYFSPEFTAPIGRALLLILIPAALTVVNLRGVAVGARLGSFLAVLKLIPLIVFGTVGLYFVDWSVFQSFAPPENAAFGPAVLLLIYAFTGFEYAVIPAAEARNPGKDIAWALVVALGIAATVYMAVQLVALGTVENLAESGRPLADASRTFLGPLAGAAMALTAVVSVVGNLSALILISPRMTYAFSERGDFPRVFSYLSPATRTPVVSIVFFTFVGVILAVSGTFVWLATVSVVARLVSYLGTCASVPILRHRSGTRAPFHLPLGPVVPLVAVALGVWLFAQTTARDGLTFGVAAAVGLCLFWARPRRSEKEKEVPPPLFL